MKNFVKFTAALLSLLFVFSFASCTKKNSQTETSDEMSTSSTEKTDVEEPSYAEDISTTDDKLKTVLRFRENDRIYTTNGELDCGDIIYSVKNGKIYSEKSGKKTLLSEQNCADNITVYGDEIYYTVINSHKKVSWGGCDAEWYDGTCWKMKNDGSEKKEMFDYIGSGYIIHIDDKYIYYVGDLEREGYYYYLKAQHGFYRYDRATGESNEVFSNGGLKYADPVYAGGSFFYCTSDGGFCRYNTATEKNTEVTGPDGEYMGLPQDVLNYDDSVIYFTSFTKIGDALCMYNVKTDSVRYLCELDDDCTEICGKGDGCLIFCTKEDYYKKYDLASNTFSIIK